MEENKNAYSEVIEILKLIDDEEKLEKLPMEMIELLKSKTNPEYKPKISMDIPLEEQNLQKETISILSWIAMKYWDEESIIEDTNKSEIETKDIEEINTQNENNTIVDKIVNDEVEEVKAEEEIGALPIAYKDLKWYEKIKIKIIEIFNKLLRNTRKIKEKRGQA